MFVCAYTPVQGSTFKVSRGQPSTHPLALASLPTSTATIGRAESRQNSCRWGRKSLSEQEQRLDGPSSAVVSEADTTLVEATEEDARTWCATDLPDWALIFQHATGSSRLTGSKAERDALAAWLCALEADLVDPPNAADRSVLGSLARVALLELRLARECFNRGLIRDRVEIRPALPELRQVIRLKADLLSRLNFRRDPRKVDDLRDTWSAGSGGAS